MAIGLVDHFNIVISPPQVELDYKLDEAGA